MKKYDIFDIVLKMSGLSIIISIFHEYVLSVFLQSLYYTPFNYTVIWTDWLLTIGALLFYLLPAYLLIFRTRFILQKVLRIGPEDEPVNLSIDKKSLIEIALIIIGGATLVRTVPHMITLIWQQLQLNKLKLEFDSQDNTKWIINDLVTICAAGLLIAYSKQIANYFENRIDKRNKLNSPEE